jgi:hypothetical protein
MSMSVHYCNSKPERTMNTEEQRKEFEEWLETVIYDNSDILSPSGLAWQAWQAAQKGLTAVTEQRDRLAEVLRNIMAYRKGEKPHDYWRLPFEERENAAFDAWMQIENSINQALQSLTQSPNNA